ncbi:hypothetical protein [Pseudomonas helleri]|uniref:Uncharacterized protein n=1 Tax=Pseudomonas helleri TaxID=1608996 RepID=A0A6L5HZD5_9PSED|nr:hypothetical protein [Pseudomonas helleri]MQU08580.1 hypothetical protein [Pseudomonas helleri]
MGLNKPTQELRRDLKDIAHLLKWSAVDLMQLAVRLSEAGLKSEALELAKKLEAFNDAEDKLAGYGDEVKAGRIIRNKPAQLRGLVRST